VKTILLSLLFVFAASRIAFAQCPAKSPATDLGLHLFTDPEGGS